jgi:hypothetical protein
VVGIFPLRRACLRLIGMLLLKTHEDCLTDDRAYLSFDNAPSEERRKARLAGGEPMRTEASLDTRALPLRSRGLTLSRQTGCGTGQLTLPPPFRPLSRRSGRFPAPPNHSFRYLQS